MLFVSTRQLCPFPPNEKLSEPLLWHLQAKAVTVTAELIIIIIIASDARGRLPTVCQESWAVMVRAFHVTVPSTPQAWGNGAMARLEWVVQHRHVASGWSLASGPKADIVAFHTVPWRKRLWGLVGVPASGKTRCEWMSPFAKDHSCLRPWPRRE